jgi:hypothetical protein
MTIRARFSPDTQDVVSTVAWLNESGVATVETWQQVYDLGVVEIQMQTVPAVLAYLSQVDDSLSISRITANGIVFYLTDIPFTMGVPLDKRQVKSDRSDGFLFVPMSNIVCVNTFGSIYARFPTPVNSSVGL